MKHATVRRVYVLHGMKRSGNHALVNWLLPQLHCTVINNAIPLGPILRGREFPQRIPFAEWMDGRRIAFDTPVVLATLEDHELSMLPFDPEGVDLRRLLVIRRPEQLFSSRIRKASRVDMPAYPMTNDEVMQRAVCVWKQHARCYLGEDESSYPGRIAVSFDAWRTNRDHRVAISAELGVDFDDSGFGRVGSEGGGSSFDGTAFDGQGHAMNLASRDSQLDPRERELLEEILADRELRRLADGVAAADPLRLLRLA